ncbi:hypothetical protein PA25_01630 [Pseudoalteromonas sp. A25]|uniref:hypothetical protein n=1 Tax=Pseudoalteromonas sp. A25 TaxID=116092 RepID=UPI00129F7ECD|nr:hypothetical protein [Pseudoalteromonas sp. A25]BBN80178.1 hypothetical protein PA25_01630 [Pseudoalteromonas sp. A25]
MKNKTSNPQTIPTHLLDTVKGGVSMNLNLVKRRGGSRDDLVDICPQVVIGSTQPG